MSTPPGFSTGLDSPTTTESTISGIFVESNNSTDVFTGGKCWNHKRIPDHDGLRGFVDSPPPPQPLVINNTEQHAATAQLSL